MTRADLVRVIEAKTAPATITAMTGSASGVLVALTDGRTITVERKRVKAAKTEADLSAYVDGLLAG